MKTNRLFFVIAVYSFSFCVMGQMKIQNDGQISIGGYGSNSMGSSTLNLFPKNEKAPARISFYNSVSNPVNDVYIGRYITSENPSLFHLYGREGFCFSSSEGDVVLYDNANYGSMIQFLNVDVIGYFYSPSDSRFKKNIQPLNNTLSGLLRLSGISYQLNKETPAGTNNIKINKKENARTHFGFLAQEVKEVYPELVRTDSAGYMYVDYIGMIPLIVNSLNEIQESRLARNCHHRIAKRSGSLAGRNTHRRRTPQVRATQYRSRVGKCYCSRPLSEQSQSVQCNHRHTFCPTLRDTTGRSIYLQSARRADTPHGNRRPR